MRRSCSAAASGALVPTGLVLQLRPAIEAQIRPRSGLALKHGITVLNTPGTIDADYRGEVKVMLVNLGAEPFAVDARHADRADGGGAGHARSRSIEVDRSTRPRAAAGGFGSTGAGGLDGDRR